MIHIRYHRIRKLFINFTNRMYVKVDGFIRTVFGSASRRCGSGSSDPTLWRSLPSFLFPCLGVLVNISPFYFIEMLFIIFRLYNSIPIFFLKIHLKKVGGFHMMATLINTLTNCRLYSLLFKKIKKKKDMRKIEFFYY